MSLQKGVLTSSADRWPSPHRGVKSNFPQHGSYHRPQSIPNGSPLIGKAYSAMYVKMARYTTSAKRMYAKEAVDKDLRDSITCEMSL